VRFELVQRLAAPASDVAIAFTDPALYEELAALPKLGGCEVLDRTAEGDTVHLRVRYRFKGDLSSAVKAVIDPAKLTWVDDAHHDLAQRTVRFAMLADHYADRFRATGSYRFDPAPDDSSETIRTTVGDIKVKMLLVGGQVERAIVSGLREHQEEEVTIVDRWLHRT
jgi:hypothetical protein